RDRERNDRKEVSMVEEKSHSSETDVDDITASLEALTINWVKQKPNNNSKIDKIESDIKELMKVVKELTINNSSSVFSHSRNQTLCKTQGPKGGMSIIVGVSIVN